MPAGWILVSLVIHICWRFLQHPLKLSFNIWMNRVGHNHSQIPRGFIVISLAGIRCGDNLPLSPVSVHIPTRCAQASPPLPRLSGSHHTHLLCHCKTLHYSPIIHSSQDHCWCVDPSYLPLNCFLQEINRQPCSHPPHVRLFLLSAAFSDLIYSYDHQLYFVSNWAADVHKTKTCWMNKTHVLSPRCFVLVF